MQTYGTWIAVKEKDAFLEDFLQNIRADTTKANLRDRPLVSLRRVGEQAELHIPERLVEERFRRMQTGDSVLAVSTAPLADMEFFHEKRFKYLASRFLVICGASPLATVTPVERAFVQAEHDTLRRDPYRNRFLRIFKLDSGASPEKLINTDVASREPNLWLDPVWIDLDENEVENHFSSTAWGATGSFILPPCRINETAGELKQYFDPILIARRASIGQFLGETSDLKRDARQIPLARTLLRLADDPSLRDLLCDGGAIDWTCQEGTPTELQVRISPHGGPGAPFRSTVILQPEACHRERWAQDLAVAIGNDLRNLLPDKGLGLVRDNETERTGWNIDRNIGGRQQEGEHSDGSYQCIERLQNKLTHVSPDPIDDLVLLPAALNLDEPDHNKAELLFTQAFWRCSCSGKGNENAWRQAFRRTLRQELQGVNLQSIETRTKQWNEEFANGSPFVLANEAVPWVKYQGPTLDWQPSAWRLQLPWRAIVTTKSLILNDPERSRLNNGNVITQALKLIAGTHGTA